MSRGFLLGGLNDNFIGTDVVAYFKVIITFAV